VKRKGNVQPHGLKDLPAVVKRSIRRRLRGLIERLISPRYLILLEYPIRPESRYGEGKPAHPQIENLLAEHDASYRETLQRLSQFRAAMARIPDRSADTKEPQWDNTFFYSLDAIALYGLIGVRRPRRYIEIGSGNSTKFARRAARDLGVVLGIMSIDPAPRAEIDGLCDRVVRQPLEDVDGSLFDDVGQGDILFVDNSHRVFTNKRRNNLLLAETSARSARTCP
jgi:hypothetical protein